MVDNPSNLVLFLSTKTIVKLSDHGIDVQPTELLLVVHRQKHLQVTAETKYLIRKITQFSKGESTLGGKELWIDESVGKLIFESRGKYLG